MEWDYTTPLSNKQEKLRKFIDKKTGDKELAHKVVKILDLHKFIVTNKPSVADLQKNVFLDKKAGIKLLKPTIAKALFRRTAAKRGGAGDSADLSEAEMIDKSVRYMISYIREYLPNLVVNLSDLVYPYLTMLKNVEANEEIGPFIDIAKEVFAETMTTGVVAANDIASDVGGPIGSAAVAIPAAIATFLVVATHILEDDLGEAVLVSFLAIPFIGPLLYKAAQSFGKVSRKLSARKKDLQNVLPASLTDYIPDLESSPEDNITAEAPTTPTDGGRRKSKIYSKRLDLIR